VCSSIGMVNIHRPREVRYAVDTLSSDNVRSMRDRERQCDVGENASMQPN
jgi:hypothetical protein